MAASRIVWTPVPNGYADGRLRISVLVSPRLSGAATLGGYADWLRWPAVRPRFSVAVRGGAKVPAAVVSPPPRVDLWQKLFAAELRVVQTPATLAAAAVPPIRSWPSVRARAMAQREHSRVLASNPTAPPTVDAWVPIGGLRSDGPDRIFEVYLRPDSKAEATQLIADQLATNGYFLGGGLGGFPADAINFLLAEQFHNRRTNTRDARLANRSLAAHVHAIQDAGDIDFHSAIGSLAQYPSLQRALGLVVDLTVDPSALGVPIPSDPLVCTLEVDWTPSGADSYEPIYPAVSATLTRTSFRPKPSGTRTRDGLLALNTDQFGVVEVDPDAGAAVLSTFSQTLITRNTFFNQRAATPVAGAIAPRAGAEPAPLPALRSTGLSIVEPGRAKQLYETLTRVTARAANIAALADDVFTAEDLTHGVRVDVWDDASRQWHSLCRRVGSYDLNGTAFSAEDEGLVTVGHTQQDNDPTVYLHESILTWNGYSLVTNRPGSTKEMVNGKEVTIGPDSEATGPVKLHTSFRAKGLPKLRYGRSYRFRARTVDIAGNSLGPDEPPASDFGSSTAPTRYLRFEPVASSMLLPVAPRTVAESVALMVIRGNFDRPAQEDCQRHVVPPRMSQAMAEAHGLYDVRPSPVNPGGIDTFAYSEIVKRDRATLTGGKADPDGWGDIEYHDEAVLEVPYLPDVLARGVALRDLPGTGPGEIFTVDFDDGPPWPRRSAFRIRLVNGTGRPAYNRASRVLTVQLPPGRSADIGYSNRIDNADVDLLGVWDWFVHSGIQPGGGRTVDDLRKLATQGQLWQLTPGATLRLVHATRQPIAASTLVKPVAVRQPGETSARIIDVLTVDRASTAKVDVRASWTEPVDAVNDPRPTLRTPEALVTSLAVGPDSNDGDRIRLNVRQEFHDTKHRQVTYSAVATSRHVEFFRQDERVTLAGTAPVLLATGGLAPGTLTVTSPDGRAEFTEDRAGIGAAGDYRVDLAAGTLARSGQGSKIADGARVDVSFVAGSVTRASAEAQPPVRVNLRSSARPAVPDVAYLVPTFGWERAADAASVSSTRRGNGVRVYLRRPWYSSGEGEMLGVVLFEGNGTIARTLEQYVTTRGQDPLSASPSTTRTPGIAEFPLAVNGKPGYRLAESATLAELTATVAVAPHAVAYDESRRLWYCDVVMTQDRSYRPFLRFALARFQPDSLTGVELSPVVLAQFAQLNPDRTLSTVFVPGDPAAVRITVAGVASAANPAEVTVMVQVADPKPLGALGWKTVSTGALTGSPGAGQWTGEVPLPGPRGSQPMRLLVEERERLSRGGSRLSYVDAVEI